MKTARILILAAGLALAQMAFAEGGSSKPLTFSIDEQPLAGALSAFAKQTGLQVIQRDEYVSTEGLMAPRLYGTLTPQAALEQLLANTGLKYEFINERTVRITSATSISSSDASSASANLQLAQAEPSSPREGGEGEGEGQTGEDAAHEESDEEEKASQRGIPEILVTGLRNRSLNADIERTSDDVQPYVVIGRKAIERSGATNIEDLLKTRLSMNYAPISHAQSYRANGNTSSIALRGLGTNETLILVDGRRISAQGITGTFHQPDLNGIPLSAIERIEVLPTTASGIYGGSATGGVVNVVLRRDYHGLEALLSYEGTSAGGSATRRIDLSGGFSLLGGNASLLVTASYSDAHPLLAEDRDFTADYRTRAFQNDPASFISPSSPPLGAVTNVSSVPVFNPVTRTFQKPNLVLKNGTSLGSPITSIPLDYAGTSTDQGIALASNTGAYNLNLAETAQISGGKRASLLNNPTIKSVSTTYRQKLTSAWDAFIELSASDNLGYFNVNPVSGSFRIAANAQNNPFAQAIQVTTPMYGVEGTAFTESKSRHALIGLIAKLSDDWRAELDIGFDRSESYQELPSTSLDPTAASQVSNGSLDVMRDTQEFPVNFQSYLLEPTTIAPSHATLKNASLRFAGPVLQTRAGRPTVSVLLEHQNQKMGEAVYIEHPSVSSVSETRYSPRVQKTNSLYAEVTLPLLPGAQGAVDPMLDVQLSGRYGDYDLVGGGFVRNVDGVMTSAPELAIQRINRFTSFDPTGGVRLRPTRDVMFRASYGTGLRPPGVDEITQATETQRPLSSVTDPRRGNEPIGSVLIRTGGNPNLDPESSKSRSFGVAITPRLIKNFRVSADWTRIEKTNNITSIGIGQDTLPYESALPGYIIRAPLEEGDPFEVGPILEVNATLLNAARARYDAWDFSVDYMFSVGQRGGDFQIFGSGTKLLHKIVQVATQSEPTESVGLQAGPKWNGNLVVAWNLRSVTAGWSVRYLDPYWAKPDHSFDLRQNSYTVPAKTYHDIFGAYAFGGATERSTLFSGLELRGGVKNVFDSPPRYYGPTASYDPWSSARMRTYYVSLRKQF